jgi:hypothetical protein
MDDIAHWFSVISYQLDPIVAALLKLLEAGILLAMVLTLIVLLAVLVVACVNGIIDPSRGHVRATVAPPAPPRPSLGPVDRFARPRATSEPSALEPPGPRP